MPSNGLRLSGSALRSLGLLAGWCCGRGLAELRVLWEGLNQPLAALWLPVRGKAMVGVELRGRGGGAVAEEGGGGQRIIREENRGRAR